MRTIVAGDILSRLILNVTYVVGILKMVKDALIVITTISVIDGPITNVAIYKKMDTYQTTWQALKNGRLWRWTDE